MLYALGFIGLFTIGGLTGVMLGDPGHRRPRHDTYFVVAHFHYIMVGGTIMAYLGGLHYWWPKITGRIYPVFLSKLSALIVFVGFNLTFFPQFILGYLGMPRRYHAYPDGVPGAQRACRRPARRSWRSATSCRSFYFVWSMRYGKKARRQPLGRGRPRVGDAPRRRRPRTSPSRRS